MLLCLCFSLSSSPCSVFTSLTPLQYFFFINFVGVRPPNLAIRSYTPIFKFPCFSTILPRRPLLLLLRFPSRFSIFSFLLLLFESIPATSLCRAVIILRRRSPQVNFLVLYIFIFVLLPIHSNFISSSSSSSYYSFSFPASLVLFPVLLLALLNTYSHFLPCLFLFLLFLLYCLSAPLHPSGALECQVQHSRRISHCGGYPSPRSVSIAPSPAGTEAAPSGTSTAAYGAPPVTSLDTWPTLGVVRAPSTLDESQQRPTKTTCQLPWH